MPTAGAASAEDARVLGRDPSGVPTFVRGSLGFLDPDLDHGEGAVAFLRQFATSELQGEGSEELVVRRVRRDDLGFVHVRIDQRIDGRPVVGAQVIVHADDLTREVYAVNGRFVPATGLAREARLDAATALELAAEQAGIFGTALDEPELVYVLGDDEKAHLAWRNLVQYEGKQGLEVDDLFADAATGALITRHPRIHRAKNWRTHDGNNGFNLPGTLRCSNNQICGDAVLQSIHDGASTIYDYYKAKFGRSSYNGSDVTITSVGHHRVNYVNAFWDGNFLVYGDGDGSQSGPLGNAFDIVAHEFTHAVTEFESNLIYQNESGAINEALSDIFGASAEAWRDGGASADTWKMGEDTWTPGVGGDALRYMNNPTQDGDSRDYYPERYTGSADNGGVHWNSGIANLAYYLMVNGGTHPRGKTSVNVTAIGLSRAEQVFYRAQTVYLGPSSGFQSARNSTAQAALDLYGAVYRDRVNDAWCAVGVGNCPVAVDDAEFVSQSVPATMAPGQTVAVSVTMRNTGTTTWFRDGSLGYKLGSQSPQGNFRWGRHRVFLANGETVAPGQLKTFNFTVTAPSSPGIYNFQWRMVHELVRWFGDFSTNRQVLVIGPQTFTVSAAADTFVAENQPNANFGTSTILRVRSHVTGVGRRSFIRFQVPPIPGTLISAKLKLRTRNVTVQEAGFYRMNNMTWNENTLTWANHLNPPTTFTYLHSEHNLAPFTTYSVDVTPAVTGSGPLTIGIASGIDTGGQVFDSRETSFAPVLEITYQL